MFEDYVKLYQLLNNKTSAKDKIGDDFPTIKLAASNNYVNSGKLRGNTNVSVEQGIQL